MMRSAAAPSSMCRSISTADSSSAVGFARCLPGDVGRAAVDGLEHRDLGPEVRRADDAEPADQAGAEIRHDVAVQVRQHQHVELLRVASRAACTRRRRSARRTGCRGTRARHVADAVEEQPVAELHDVRLVDRRHLLAAVPPRVLEGELRDARRRALGDDLQALDDAGHDFVLEPGVEILGVLADDDEVDALEPRRRRRAGSRPAAGSRTDRAPCAARR